MTESPYKPPGSQVGDSNAAPFSLWMALAAGCAGYGAIFVAWTLLLPLWQQLFLAGGVPLNGLNRALYADAVFNIYRVALIAAAGAIAGMLATRFCEGRPFQHAAVSTLPIYAVFIGRYLGIYGLAYPWWSELLAFLLPVPFALLGARLQQRRAVAASERSARA